MKRCWCGNEDLQPYSTQYNRCRACDTLVSKHNFSPEIIHVENEEKDLYGSNYWEKVMTKEAGVDTVEEIVELYLSGRAIYWLEKILQYARLGGNVLEVGCGLGQLSYLLDKTGFAQEACELSREICDFVKERLGINVIKGTLDDLNGGRDLIVSMDVLEHLLEPESFVEMCKRKLKQKGIFCLQTPCYNPQLSYDNMLRKAPSFQKLLVEKQHVFLFSKNSLKCLLKKCGFQYILFEHAYFGDDYDMFLFASDTPFEMNSVELIKQYLNKKPEGYLVQALMSLAGSKKKLSQEMEDIKDQRRIHLNDIERLTVMVQKQQEEIKQISNTCEERLEIVNRQEKQIEMLTHACEERLSVVNRQKEQIEMLTHACEERLSVVNRQKEQIEMLTHTCEERLGVINTQQLQLKALEHACEERLDVINRQQIMIETFSKEE